MRTRNVSDSDRSYYGMIIMMKIMRMRMIIIIILILIIIMIVTGPTQFKKDDHFSAGSVEMWDTRPS